MSHYTFIVNPAAGRGDATKLVRRLRGALRERGIDHTIVLTAAPGDATTKARESASDVVVAVGGDGTINEVANGLVGSSKALGIIPAGSGNDFIKSCGIPEDFEQALAILCAGKRRRIDLGTVQCTKDGANGSEQPEVRCFVNGVGIGFDAAVAARTQEIRHVSGTTLYLLAVFQTLGRYSFPTFTYKVDHTIRESKNLLIAVGNGRCAGGGFYLTPDAVIDDGWLDICVIEEKSVPQILRLMSRVMKGKHGDIPGVTIFRDTGLVASAREPFHVHADGEIVGRNVNRVDIGIMKACLDVVVG